MPSSGGSLRTTEKKTEAHEQRSPIVTDLETAGISVTMVYVTAPGPDVGCAVCGGAYCEFCWNDPGRPGLILVQQQWGVGDGLRG